jgi:hypothetical protein
MESVRLAPASLRRVFAVGSAACAAIALVCSSAAATTCSTVAACVLGVNTRSSTASGFGADAGVAATSVDGDGLDAETTFASKSSSNARSGIAGFDASTTGTFNSGVFGYSGKGTGVHGVTNDGVGVLAASTSAQGLALRVTGASRAVAATFVSGVGLSLQDGANLAHESNTGIAVSDLGDGIDVGTDFGVGLTVTGGAMGSGAVISSSGGDALDIDQSGPGIPLFINPDGGASEDELLVSGLLSLDPAGNLTLSGSLTQNGTPMSATQTTTGRALRTYAPREAEATIEDVGETTVRNGRALVALDPAFAATLDPSRPYYVFLTAEGENRGLYVTAKSARGFAIRESYGGLSTLDVQYRIVAKPYDARQTPRLAPIDFAALRGGPAAGNRIAKLKRQESRSAALLKMLRNNP